MAEVLKPPPTIYERYPELSKIPKERFPRHVLIIPDGNGRWAKDQGFLPIRGHQQGARALQEILRDLRELPIGIVTVWGFSSDNWARPKEEVNGLMRLYGKVVKHNLGEFIEKNIRFVHLGRKDRIPESLRLTLAQAEEATKNNTGQILSVAIDFGGEDQELRIGQKIVQMTMERIIKSTEELTPELLFSLRDGGGLIPPADLIIRTSGEIRTSDIGWLNGKQTELYFTYKLFPELGTKDVTYVLVNFSKRERRFGGRP